MTKIVQMKNKSVELETADPKILIFDIETAPNVGSYFELYKEGNILWNETDWYVLSWAAKWLGERETIVKALPDYRGYKTNPEDDSGLVKSLWNLFDEADVVVAHNGDAFDIKKMNTRFIINRLRPPSPFKSIDTKKVCKQNFRFDSNKLNDVARQLGLGSKLDTGDGKDLWKRCLRGDLQAWKKMCAYNKQDVILLEKVYLELLPWMKNHPNRNVFTDKNGCPKCGSNRVQKRGFEPTATGRKQRYRCNDCGGWCYGATERVRNLVIR